MNLTEEVAASLAEIAGALEETHPPPAVADFLMRCLYAMFTKGPLDTSALRLTQEQRRMLLDVAERDWSKVDLAIFGTLAERALSPKERHRLGAHYTPRAYVERLVRPTVEEPLRAEWDAVRARARRHREQSRAEDERRALRAFHTSLTQIKVLDPACGTGNFLYVTLDILKQLESEILAELRDLGEPQEVLGIRRVSPAQLLGIEVNPRAKAIAELVLRLGDLLWHPPGPVLQDLHNIECRDAVLAWDRIDPVRDENGCQVTRWDGETMKKNPVTGELVPDEDARVAALLYINPRRAEWPKADYIVGNPPFLGTRRMRLTLGDGYVDALKSAIPEVAENADYVMYFWDHAAELVRTGRARRFGFITTNSITQAFNRTVLHRHLEAKMPISIAFAVPDHPWVDAGSGASVRVAMTTGTAGDVAGKLFKGAGERSSSAPVLGKITEDLRVGASPAAALPCRANAGIAYWGVKFYGDGFIVTHDEALQLASGHRGKPIIRPFMSGRDLTQAPRSRLVIDCDGLSEDDLARKYRPIHQHLLEHVRPVRDQNPRALKRERWWIFGENQPGMRRAVAPLPRYIATTETAKHRVFHFLDGEVLAEGTVTVIALDDAFFLGVLSSRVHVTWALAAGGRLGVGNDPRYNKTRCFDPFPFPARSAAVNPHIRRLAESLDAHRKRQQAAHPDLTITGMYNVLSKRRAGEELTDKDRLIHQRGGVAVLEQIHDDLDAAVFDAYGWPSDLTDEEILERLVALNAERAEEEGNGLVRWLRPELQRKKAWLA